MRDHYKYRRVVRQGLSYRLRVTVRSMIKAQKAPQSGTLLKALVLRDLSQRYRGSRLGIFWAFLLPLLLLAVYSFVFRTIFAARWQIEPDIDRGVVGLELLKTLPEGFLFACNLFIGLLVLSVFSEVVNRAPKLIVEQPQLVRRVVFPLPLLGAVLTISALIQAFIQWLVLFIALIVAMVVFAGSSHSSFQSASAETLVSAWAGWLLVQVPLSVLVLLYLAPMLLAISWTFAAIGTYFRDIAHLTPALMSVLMFLGPVFYPKSALPDPYSEWILLNPLTVVAEQLRRVLLQGAQPDWYQLHAYLVVGLVLAWLGRWLFIRVQAGFADVV